MEAEDGPAAVNNPSVVKAAQEEMGRLDVLVCGQCHSVFHFVEEFQEHRSKEGACSKTSHFRDNGNNEQKAQVWAFLLWKDTQIQQEGPDRDSANSWKLYQRWCKMESHVRETWVTAGKTIQTFTKINNAKMTDFRPTGQTNITSDGVKQPIVVRKVIRNGQPEESTEVKKEVVIKQEIKSQPGESTTPQEKKVIHPRPKALVKPRVKPGKLASEADEPNEEEFVVEKIVAKRYNTKKRCPEYYLKWEGLSPEFNTWESADVISSCKFLLDEFERNLAKQKEMKELKAQQLAQQQQQQQQQQQTKIITTRPVPLKTIVKSEPSSIPGPSSAAQISRPMRSSKSKAMDQVKQWCGSMKEEEGELLGKRRAEFTDSDSEDITLPKRIKGETGSDEDWSGESEDERLVGRSDVIQRAFNRANAQSNGSNKANTIVSSSDLSSLHIQTSDGSKVTHQTPVLVANAKGVVKVDPKQMPNLASGVYVMSKKEGIIKLDSSPSGKIGVKGSPNTQGVLMVQNREPTVVRRQVITATQANSITPVKVVSKPDGSQIVTQMKVISKPVQTKPRPSLAPKTEPVKIQPKPDPNQLQQIHVVTAVPTPIGIQPKMATTTIRPTIQSQQSQSSPQQQTQKTPDGRPLLPRPPLRGATPTSVLGVGSVRTPVRALAPRLPTAQTRPIMQQKRIIASSPQAVVSPNQSTQMRSKITVLTTQSNPVVKTVSTVAAKSSPKPPVKPSQSLLSPQQKLLMAKRKAQEAVGLTKTFTKTVVASPKTPQGRGRGKITPVAAVSTPGKPKETKIVESDGLHMEFQENEPDSPPRPFTLCPLTGRIIGPDGEPMDTTTEPEPEQPTTTSDPVTSVTTTVTSSENSETTNVTTPTTAELVLPSLDVLTDASGIMRVEMSPGGTTGTIVQASTDATQINLTGVTVAAPDLPCLDDTTTTSVGTPIPTAALTETTASEATTTSLTATVTTSVPSITTNIKDIKEEDKKVIAEDTSNLVTITGEDGVVYQVAGHADDGQTLLVTRGADGEQQCVYVTTEQQGDDGSVLTLDHAVAEAVAQLMPDQVNLTPQFYVKEGEGEAAEGQMVMSIMDNNSGAVGTQEDPDGQAQVVAQVVQADEPTPGGTRRVVLLLPDGNLMMTEVDEEQYAALELDK
ncbi:endochitinase A isoform X2 [Chelonus insularis]|uniref:endochitinase A isoform X2 n=1 Tax=Chelonus insularis TaxID=460826 RepID=UPI00158EA0F2|nr:endochitinase A isoform X2 [Chelonus insularis]